MIIRQAGLENLAGKVSDQRAIFAKNMRNAVFSNSKVVARIILQVLFVISNKHYLYKGCFALKNCIHR